MKEYNACGVLFKRAGKVYDFLCEGYDVKHGDNVVVESDKGEDMARVCVAPRLISVPDEQVMKNILRIATDEDIKAKEQNLKDEPKAFDICKKLSLDAGLDMKLLSAEYCLDRSKITFYFTSEGRVDFRQLVRDLARIFRTRIEMRQIGVRDATKMIGGFGLCGRELCCTNFLRRFDNISIKMAKDQNLIMNPNKISGVCGRLMCCLMFEKEQYDGCDGCGNCEGCDDNVEYIELNDTIDALLEENTIYMQNDNSIVNQNSKKPYKKPYNNESENGEKENHFKKPYNNDNNSNDRTNYQKKHYNNNGNDTRNHYKKHNKNYNNSNNNNNESI